MENKTDDLVNVILESYNKYDLTVRIDAEHMLNKDILIKVTEEIRRVLFPGFFDERRVRSEYIKFLIGERLEFIQYNLKKQIAKAFGTRDLCSGCQRSAINEKAEETTHKFIELIPKIREYLYTDIQAAYDGDPAAYSTDEIIFS